MMPRITSRASAPSWMTRPRPPLEPAGLRRAARRSTPMMDRFWLLTWTTYGSWLPGDARGFVSEVRDEEGNKVLHNEPGTPCDADLPSLARYAASRMTEDGVVLNRAQAEAIALQLRETAEHR